MKEIKKEKTTTQTYSEYEAIDGTLFTNREDCQEYENTARCVLRARVQRLIVTKEHNAWNLLGGLDDDNVVGIKFNCDNDVKDFLQYYCLDHTYYMRDEHKDKLLELSNKCYDARKNNDILLVGINCDEEYYIINTVQNIVDNLLHIEDGSQDNIQK